VGQNIIKDHGAKLKMSGQLPDLGLLLPAYRKVKRLTGPGIADLFENCYLCIQTQFIHYF
jgi:hypothetical protein